MMPGDDQTEQWARRWRAPLVVLALVLLAMFVAAVTGLVILREERAHAIAATPAASIKHIDDAGSIGVMVRQVNAAAEVDPAHMSRSRRARLGPFSLSSSASLGASTWIGRDGDEDDSFGR